MRDSRQIIISSIEVSRLRLYKSKLGAVVFGGRIDGSGRHNVIVIESPLQFQRPPRGHKE